MFISFEGIDSSGKKTQAEMLAKALKQMGYEVVELSFPAYNTTFGKIVAAYLRGEYGPKDSSPEITALLFAIDRYQFKKAIEDSLKQRKIIICNRFTQSAMAFEGTMHEDKIGMMKWIEKVESRLPQPNLIIFVDMPIEASKKLMENREKKGYLKGKSKDILEEDLNFQNAVRKTYLEMAKRDKRWVVINCANRVGGDWEIRKPEEIHEDVLKFVRNFMRKQLQ